MRRGREGEGDTPITRGPLCPHAGTVYDLLLYGRTEKSTQASSKHSIAFLVPASPSGSSQKFPFV